MSSVEAACQDLVRLRYEIENCAPVCSIVWPLRLDLHCRCLSVFLWSSWLVHLFEFWPLIVPWLKFDLTDTHTLLVSQTLVHQYHCTLVWVFRVLYHLDFTDRLNSLVAQQLVPLAFLDSFHRQSQRNKQLLHQLAPQIKSWPTFVASLEKKLPIQRLILWLGSW